MNPEQTVKRVVQATSSRLSELYDGYVLVALTPAVAGGDELPIIITNFGTPKTRLALRAMLADVCMGGSGEEQKPHGG